MVVRVSDFLALKPSILPPLLPPSSLSNVSMFRDEFYASMVEVGGNIKVYPMGIRSCSPCLSSPYLPC